MALLDSIKAKYVSHMNAMDAKTPPSHRAASGNQEIRVTRPDHFVQDTTPHSVELRHSTPLPMPTATTLPYSDVQTPDYGFDVEEYRQLARRAGFTAGDQVIDEVTYVTDSAARIERFKRFLAENGVTVYDTRRVNEYLNSICPEGSQVVWMPVNEKIDFVISFSIDGTGFRWRSQPSGIYRKPLPIPVLHTMCKFTESGGEFKDVQFYASDFTQVQRPDPFLAVTIDSSFSYREFFVIERWDEPGFRG